MLLNSVICSGKMYSGLVIAAIFMCGILVRAQSLTQESETHYKITYWTTDDGMPGNACVKIFQDQEGFLWMGGFDGLVRFDGARFVVYNKSNLFTSNFALAIVGDEEGNLWIGTDHGIVHYKNGKFTDHSDKDHNF